MAAFTTPENITKLNSYERFVFGSNYAGRHGKGAAKIAQDLFGAVPNIGTGPMGKCYAIATKDEKLRVLPLAEIRGQVKVFEDYAYQNPEFLFLVTKIGCGYAGYTPQEIAPMFAGVFGVWNVILPEEFYAVLEN